MTVGTHTYVCAHTLIYSLACSLCRHWITFKEFILHAKRVWNARRETRSALVFVFTAHTHIPICVCVCVRLVGVSVCLRVCWITRFKNNFVDFLIFYCAYQIRIQAEIPKRRQNASLTHTHTHTHAHKRDWEGSVEEEREIDRCMHVLLSVGCWFRDFSSHVACDVYEYISQLATASRREGRDRACHLEMPPTPWPTLASSARLEISTQSYILLILNWLWYMSAI